MQSIIDFAKKEEEEEEMLKIQYTWNCLLREEKNAIRLIIDDQMCK